MLAKTFRMRLVRYTWNVVDTDDIEIVPNNMIEKEVLRLITLLFTTLHGYDTLVL